MFIELVDALRCPAAHEESWLVASTALMKARHIVSGTLGCPVCLAEYPIEHGVVDFRRSLHGEYPLAKPHAEDAATRVAAMLGLSDATGFAVLLGQWGTLALTLTAIVETPLIAVDPPFGVIGSPGLSVVRCDGDIPLATGSARGIAVDSHNAFRIGDAVRVARTMGRVLAPASVASAAGLRELARDEHVWVAEREAASSAIVTLHVRRGVT